MVLRDGKTLIGYLRSVDQFGSLDLSCPAPKDLSMHSIQCYQAILWLRQELFLVVSPPAPLPHPANLLLQDTVERIHVGTQFGDIPRGIYLVRGENVALCGEIVSLWVPPPPLGNINFTSVGNYISKTQKLFSKLREVIFKLKNGLMGGLKNSFWNLKVTFCISEVPGLSLPHPLPFCPSSLLLPHPLPFIGPSAGSSTASTESSH